MIWAMNHQQNINPPNDSRQMEVTSPQDTVRWGAERVKEARLRNLEKAREALRLKKKNQLSITGSEEEEDYSPRAIKSTSQRAFKLEPVAIEEEEEEEGDEKPRYKRFRRAVENSAEDSLPNTTVLSTLRDKCFEVGGSLFFTMLFGVIARHALSRWKATSNNSDDESMRSSHIEPSPSTHVAPLFRGQSIFR